MKKPYEKLSRRQFLKTAGKTAGGLWLASYLPPLLSGCGGGGQEAVQAKSIVAAVRTTTVADSVRRAVELSGVQKPAILDTLAAAYAEAGRFPEAVEAAQKAVDATRAGGNDQLAAMGEQLLNLFRSSKPYHEPAATPATSGPK